MVKKKTKNNTKNIQNSFEDIAAGYGMLNPNATPLSKTDPLFYNNRWQLLSNMRQVLSQMYAEHGLIQALIDTPVEDAMRGGYTIHSEQLDEKDIKELHIKFENDGCNNEVAQVLKWNRLFGGGGLICMTNQKHEEKLDLENLNELEFRAADLWELFYSLQNVDDENSKLTVRPDKDFIFDYYGKKLHNSRVMLTKGITPPSFVRPRLRGWGLSVVESLVQSLNQNLKAKNLSYEILDEFKVDYYKIRGVNQAMLSKDGVDRILKLVQLVNQQKNYQNAVVLDSEDDHQAKQLSFTGLAETLKEIRIQIAADMRMPMTKLFGISSAGFNSGEDDIEVYNAMVESTVRFRAKPVLVRALRLYCQKLFGIMPDDLEIEWKPLRVLSSEQEENVKNSKFNRVTMALSLGLCSIKEAKQSINKENLLPVKVDEELETPPVVSGGAAVTKTPEIGGKVKQP